MPTSAPNSSSAGFTLVETMAALFIVGLAAGAVVLMAPGQDARTRAAAERLAARLKAASDVSVMTNRDVALVVTAEGYGFERQEEAGWQRVDSEPALVFRAWPAGLVPHIELPKQGEAPMPRIAQFDPLGGATPLKIVLDDASSRWAVAIDDAGEIRVNRAE